MVRLAQLPVLPHQPGLEDVLDPKLQREQPHHGEGEGLPALRPGTRRTSSRIKGNGTVIQLIAPTSGTKYMNQPVSGTTQAVSTQRIEPKTSDKKAPILFEGDFGKSSSSSSSSTPPRATRARVKTASPAEGDAC